MFRVKCKVADWCEGNDRGYYRKPKEFIYTNKFKTEKEAQEFMEKEKAKHTPPKTRASIYSDYEVIKDLDENFDIYKKDQKYNIIYSDQDGKDNEFEFTPKEDMSKPEMIMKCKEANKNFIKLKEIKKLEEGVHKMEENQNINTLADLIKSRDGEGLDIGDNTIDMIVYFEYDGDSDDTFDRCLKTIAKGTKVIQYEDNYAVVDLYNYVKEHLGAFENYFDLSGTTEDEEIANCVDTILPGLFSGYTTDSVYSALNNDLLKGVQKKEESFEDSKKFMAGEILAIIDRYIHTSDLENLFKEMDIDQSIYEGDQDIPDGKIQDIVEIGLQWLFDHLQPEDYKRVLKNDLEMTDEEMEKYGVELDESKKVEEEQINYSTQLKELVERAQYEMGLDEFYNFLKFAKGIIDKKLNDNEPVNKIEEDVKFKVNDNYFLNNNLIWDQRTGDLAIGIGASQIENIKEAEDQSGVTVDENIKKYLEEHPANLFIVEGQVPNIKVTLLGDQSGNPTKIDNLRVNG